MKMLEALVSFLSAASLAILGWAFQLSKQVAVLEARDEDYKELVSAYFEQVNHRLDRIEKAMNGAFKH